MRRQLRRYTRLANAVSKKFPMRMAIHALGYHFVRVHKSRRVSPAMEAKRTATVRKRLESGHGRTIAEARTVRSLQETEFKPRHYRMVD